MLRLSRFIRHAVGLATPLVLTSAFVTGQTFDQGWQQVAHNLDQIAGEAVKRPENTSIALAAVSRNATEWSKHYGVADDQKKSAANGETAYRVGSSAFTGIMLLQLMHDGKVHLSDRVDKYFPEIRTVPSRYPDAAPVTIVQLATHMTGLDADLNFRGGSEADWRKRLVETLPHARYAAEPGTHSEWSPINDAILIAVLSHAAGKPYTEFVRERIFAPLGMGHTGFDDASATGPVAHTTLDDLAKFAQFELLGGPDAVLPRENLEENYRRLWIVNSVAVPNPSEGIGIGYRGETWTSNGNSHYYFIPAMDADVPDYHAAFWFEPRSHTGIIMLQHGEGPVMGALIHSLVYTRNAQRVDAGRQDLREPFPYRSEEVAFENAGVRLQGTLTTPSGSGPFPAAVLVPPAGPFDRDVLLLNHRVFLVIAAELSKKGIAVLRYDSRGRGKSGGNAAGATRSDSASDANAALRLLRTRSDIDSKRIGVLGLGDGSRAAAITAKNDAATAFLLLLSPPSLPASQTFADRGLRNAKVSGQDYQEAEKQAELDRKSIAAVIKETDRAALHEKLAAILAGSMPPDQMEGKIKQLSSPAFRQLLTDDPGPEFRGLACPVLALFGENDLNSPPQSIAAMREHLKSAGNARSEVRVIPGVNFMMQSSDTGLGREANWVEETISPVVLDQIAAWITPVK